MYRCSGYIDECISVSCREIKTPIHVECMDFDSIDMGCRCLDEDIDFILNKEEEVLVGCIVKDVRIVVTCSIICSINDISFLRVQPDYVWLTPDILSSSEFEIISNVNWIIN